MYTGLGKYPGDPCFDPQRPSWMPYWLNDNAEAWCKLQSNLRPDFSQLVDPAKMQTQYPAPALPPAPKPPVGYQQTGGPNTVIDPNTATDQIIAAQKADWNAREQQFFDDLAAANPPEGPGTDYTTVALVVAAVAAFSLFRN